MDPCIQLCIDVIRYRIDYLLSQTENTTEHEHFEAVLRELFVIRDEIDELNWLLVMS